MNIAKFDKGLGGMHWGRRACISWRAIEVRLIGEFLTESLMNGLSVV